MQERETRNVKTPVNHIVVLRTYLTGREVNDIKRALFGSVSVARSEDGKPVIPQYPLSLAIDREKKLLEYTVVSVDAVKENAADKVQDLVAGDYKFVVAEAEKSVDGNF
jgi:hypothetical protein